MWTLLISCLIHSFLDKVQKNQKWVFKIRESLPFLYINLYWRAKFQISRFLILDSDWLNFIHFSRYKYKIRLFSRLRKRENQALISISTILKFPAQKKCIIESNNTQRMYSSMNPNNKDIFEKFVGLKSRLVDTDIIPVCGWTRTLSTTSEDHSRINYPKKNI